MVRGEAGEAVYVTRAQLTYPDTAAFDHYCGYAELESRSTFSSACSSVSVALGDDVTENRFIITAPGYITEEHIVTPCEGYSPPPEGNCYSVATYIILQADPAPTAICEAYCARALECTPEDAEPLSACIDSCLDGLALSGEPDGDACRQLYVAYYDCVSLVDTCEDFVAHAQGTAAAQAPCSKIEGYITQCEEELGGPSVPGN